MFSTIRLVEPRYVLGNNIRAVRKEQNLTQEGLASRAGMHLMEIGRAERGGRDLRVSTVVKIARGLGVEAMELMRGIK